MEEVDRWLTDRRLELLLNALLEAHEYIESLERDGLWKDETNGR